MDLDTTQKPFNADANKAHSGYNTHKVVSGDFKSIAFIGTFRQCCDYLVNNNYLQGYVIASYHF